MRGPAGAQFFGGQDSTDPNQEVIRLTSKIMASEEAATFALGARHLR